ncbi:MAG: glycerate kinase [Kiritimatiellae bacterium]|nr:glycerate kinase [Kiritimatiellia bacterium]
MDCAVSAAAYKAPRIAIAPDSFKGSLSAMEAAASIAEGLKLALPHVRVRLIPMADGGEGTVDAMIEALGARHVRAPVRNPLGRKITACYGWHARRKLAVMEMAAASGLTLLTPRERHPLRTSTSGTGELLRHALDRGVRHIVIGIGGSATNDGGTGMASALGARFLDRHGRDLPPGGGALIHLRRVVLDGLDARLTRTRIEAACDVTNPLCGPRGASFVYGPQKGATPAMARRLDGGLARLAEAMQTLLGRDLAQVPGAGAAGGLGFGLMAFCGAQLRRGVEMVAECAGLEPRLKGCDLVITGEGRIDGQTVQGKTPVGVAAVARRVGIPTIAICGCLGDGYEAVHAAGIAAVFPVAHGFYDPDRPLFSLIDLFLQGSLI